jgi:hypothetical protein
MSGRWTVAVIEENARFRRTITAMPGPVLTALAAVPWTTILKQAPVLLAAAKAIQANVAAPRAPLKPDANIEALRERIVQLEATQEEHARLLTELAAHTARLASVTDAALRLCRLAMVVGGAGLGLAIVACALALLL